MVSFYIQKITVWPLPFSPLLLSASLPLLLKLFTYFFTVNKLVVVATTVPFVVIALIVVCLDLLQHKSHELILFLFMLIFFFFFFFCFNDAVGSVCHLQTKTACDGAEATKWATIVTTDEGTAPPLFLYLPSLHSTLSPAPLSPIPSPLSPLPSPLSPSPLLPFSPSPLLPFSLPLSPLPSPLPVSLFLQRQQ